MKKLLASIFALMISFNANTAFASHAPATGYQSNFDQSSESNQGWSIGYTMRWDNAYAIERYTGKDRSWVIEYQPMTTEYLGAIFFGTQASFFTVSYKQARLESGRGPYTTMGITLLDEVTYNLRLVPSFTMGYEWRMQKISMGGEIGLNASAPIAFWVRYRF